MYLLLALLFIKHFLCDYPLQTSWMLRKSHPTEWFWPLTTHAAFHAGFTLVILLFFTNVPFALSVALLEFSAHWNIDYAKAQYSKAKFGSTAFWNHLGLDQLFHNLTYLAIIFAYSLYMA